MPYCFTHPALQSSLITNNIIIENLGVHGLRRLKSDYTKCCLLAAEVRSMDVESGQRAINGGYATALHVRHGRGCSVPLCRRSTFDKGHQAQLQHGHLKKSSAKEDRNTTRSI